MTPDIQQVLDGHMRLDVEVQTFERSERLYPSAVVYRGAAVHPLLPAATPLRRLQIQSNGATFDLFDYLADDRIAGLLILKQDKVVFED